MESYKTQLTKNGKVIIAVCLILLLAVLSLGTEIYLKMQGYIVIKNAKITGDVVYVNPSISGRIDSIDIKEGDIVKKGQVLVKLNVNEIKYQVDKAYAELAIAKTRLSRAVSGPSKHELSEAKALLSDADTSYRSTVLENGKLNDLIKGKQNTYNSLKSLAIKSFGLTGKIINSQSMFSQINRWHSRGMISRAKYNSALGYIRRMGEMEAKLDALKGELYELDLSEGVAKAELNVAATRLKLLTASTAADEIKILKNEVKEAGADYELAKRTLNYSVIKAPSDGTVIQTAYHNGDVIGSGQSVVSLVDFSKLFVMVYMRQKDIGNIKIGQFADISMDGLSGKNFRGRIKEIGTAVQPALTAYQTSLVATDLEGKIPVKIALDCKGSNIVPEMNAKVKIKIIK